ncbi:endo alpha-1,4 polygalactosaminidase precursor (macronuclear) [Tetrahymena thermophila SB210]|uniref:Endo alpha-1,4 polygalactosaminidase n=1 Tax=Tetrahymena thermophila (strain SB210) TaxID=312017 RepID=I7MN08_TETTS|nr:endo alpha-1,4 polygalactosaminidase precursor [Tetrahymena thermophila SB210]EAS07684.1 endo alpha-1,4 polygalactosaminidase precursor [Tetrahymena thermophila SB210]|eukprot:XP_001027926.1 endo alpha-1,4 polygalactosaminidase precursor [Tetrahymena thermophila SB210]
MGNFKNFNAILCLILICGNYVRSQNPYVWQPSVKSTFYYQTGGVLNYGVKAQIYFIDFLRNQSAVADLKNSGRRVVCNFSIGIYERNLADSNNIPKNLLGNSVPGMYQASFINIAGYQTSGVGSVMTARIDLAKQLGCDAVQFDNYDYYQMNSVTGLLLNYQIQLSYFQYLAYYARSQGLAVCLKNNLSQASDLFNSVDFVFSDTCDGTSASCNYMDQYVNNNKAAFGISYRENYLNYIVDQDWQQLCVQYILKNYSWLIRTKSQDGYSLRCAITSQSNQNIISSSSTILGNSIAITLFAFVIIFTF